jgi:hypothetical protein
MRTFTIVAIALCLCLCAFGQIAPVVTPAPATPPVLTTVYGAGVSYSEGGSPSVAGTGLYAHLLAGTSTYAFTVADILPNNTKPFTVSTNIAAGVAQKIATISGRDILIPTAAGISVSGGNTGWVWSTGAMVVFHLKNNWLLMPNVRIIKSSVGNGTGYQPVIGMMFGWGQ